MQYRMHQPESTLQSLFAEDISFSVSFNRYMGMRQNSAAVQVDALWRLAFQQEPGMAPQRTPERWALVLRNSFAVQAIFEVDQDAPGGTAANGIPPRHRRLIGFAR